MAALEENVEVREVGLPFPPAPMELVVHNAVIGVQHVPMQDGSTMTLAQFFTPAFTITVKLDQKAAEQVADDLRPSPIQIARIVPR